MCVLIIARVGVVVIKVIIMTVICIAAKRLMTIDVVIVVMVVNTATTVVMSAIVITITLKRTTTVVVVGRIVGTAITDVIAIISITSIIIIMNAISMTVTSVCASVVYRKKKVGRRAAGRTTAPSRRGAISLVDLAGEANAGSEPVAPAQKAAWGDGSMRFLIKRRSRVLRRRTRQAALDKPRVHDGQ